MAPKSKSKKQSSSLADYQNMTLDTLANLNDADDEEIDEESAFNSEDEKTFGKYFGSSSPKNISIRSKNVSLPIPLNGNVSIHTVEIAKGSKMTLSSVCLDVSQVNFDQVKLLYKCIYPNQDRAIDACLCNYLSVKKGGMGLMPVTPVTLDVIGPCKMEFRAEISAPKKWAGEGSMNIFGVIVPVDHFVGDDAPFHYAFASEEEDESVTESVASNGDINGDNDDGKSNGASSPAAKKRKVEKEVEEEKPASEQPASASNPDETSDKKLTKKQRKKLAQEKSKQLEETLSAARTDTNIDESTNDDTAEKKNPNKKKRKAEPGQSLSKNTKLTRERRIKGGLVVSDILLGTGAPVKPGKKISLHYTGTLRSTGKVFDKNNSKQHPLVFRQGTGEVIRGLERGLEGMRVGGERVVTVPAKLGYGKKGAGVEIPPDSDLVFEVKVLKVG